ncbi:MAG: lysophospholipid acyltransferase family protein [Fidelibacterota bacterium]
MRFNHQISYYALTVFSGWLRSLSESERDRFSLRLARIAYYILSLRKKDSANNIAIAFSEKTAQQQDKILKNSYAFFAKSFLQFFALPKSYRFVDINIKGKNLLDDAIKKGRGVILATGHFGKWEMMSVWLGRSGYPVYAVAHRQKNKGADLFFKNHRQKTGMEMIYRKSSLKNMYRILEENKILVLGSDQDAKSRGIFINFFNKPASTPKGVARFHLETHSPILFVSCHLDQAGKYQLEIQPVNPNAPPTVESITQAYTRLLEEKIRQFPDQYFWFHRRWKSKPTNSE